MKYEKTTLGGVVSTALPKSYIDFTPVQAEKLKNIASVILGVVALGGMMTASMVVPNVLKLINSAPWAQKTFRNSLSKNREQKRALVKSFYYLKSKGYISLNPIGKDFEITILENGRKKLRHMNLLTLSVPKQKWDGGWWFVLADIPTDEFRIFADYLRTKLRQMNFYPLQRTVWVYPHDPREQIAFVSGYYKIDRFVTVLKANIVDQDDDMVLKTYFKKLKLI